MLFMNNMANACRSPYRPDINLLVTGVVTDENKMDLGKLSICHNPLQNNNNSNNLVIAAQMRAGLTSTWMLSSQAFRALERLREV
jgi:hypothetical protein